MTGRHLDEQRGAVPEVQVHRLPRDACAGTDSGEGQPLDPVGVGFLPSGIEQAGVSRRIRHRRILANHLTRVNQTRFTRVK